MTRRVYTVCNGCGAEFHDPHEPMRPMEISMQAGYQQEGWTKREGDYCDECLAGVCADLIEVAKAWNMDILYARPGGTGLLIDHNDSTERERVI